MNKTKVCITGTGSLVGQAIIKSIINSSLAKDISMVGFDYFKDTVGSYWVEKNFLLPDFLKKEVKIENWLEKVIKYINLEDIRLLFIGIDFELKLFAKYKNVIESETKCQVIISNLNVIEIADDKYLTYKFLKNNNLYYAETVLPEELNKKDINFPCVLKPRFGTSSRDVFVVNNRKELEERLPLVEKPIIQEFIGSPSDEYTCGVIYFDNSVKEMIALRRNLKDGNTATAYFNKNTPKIIYEYIYKVSSILKPFGACNFQLRLNKDGIPKIFEVNSRHSGTTYIRSLFGFNEVEYILAYLLGLEIKKFRLREGIIKRYYDEKFIESK